MWMLINFGVDTMSAYGQLGIDQTGSFTDDGFLCIYDFENRDDAWGAPYATNLIYKWFPNAHQIKGINVHQTPIGKLVGTCRRVVLISKRNRKAIEWMQNNIDGVDLT